MRALIEATGFRALAWDDITSAHSAQRLIMGERLDEIPNPQSGACCSHCSAGYCVSLWS
jgi:hypothetical protein